MLYRVVLILVAAVSLMLSSCSRKTKVTRMGWQTVVNLPTGRKLVGVTWKGNDLWVVTRLANTNESTKQEWYMEEVSAWGMLNSHLVLRETSCDK